MFSRREDLEKKTGPDGIGRDSFIRLLTEEYEDSNTSPTNKQQVLANLANFAYDPINLEYLRFIGITFLFTDHWRNWRMS